jgi:hypothetical protein
MFEIISEISFPFVLISLSIFIVLIFIIPVRIYEALKNKELKKMDKEIT